MESQSQTAAIAAAAAALSGADSAAARRQLALLYQQLAVDDRRYVLEADRDEIFRRLRRDNRMCFDCSSRNPTWISLTHAIYVCLTCSGKHRRLGTHLSFVRSTEMDKMFPEQLFRMELGGNRRAHDFLREHGADLSQPLDYHGKLAAKHRQMLDRLVNAELQGIGWLTGTQQDSAGAQQQQKQLPAAAATAPASQQQPHRMQETRPYQAQQHTGMFAAAAAPAAAPAAAAVAAPAPVAVAAAPVGAPAMGVSAMPSGASRGVRSRKLEMDFDFEKEAALLAARQRAAAQGAAQSGGTPTQTGSQPQQTGGPWGGSSNSSNGAMSLGGAPNSAAGSASFGSNATTALGSGAGSNKGASQAGGYGSNSRRFSGAKSISSAQFFQEEESSPPVAALPVDPSRRAIGSDEVFGRSSSGRRGWEDQSAARVEALRMHAQQGWQQLSQVGSDALSKAREWLAGT
ncbi:hypothetical protein Efla_005009 [Eimeria flavescens]